MDQLIAFIFGLIIGSFLNVVILRFDDWISIISTRSHCPDCKTELRWYDLVPLLSFITLRGKCRYCHKPISWQYPIVELSVGVLYYSGYNLIFHYSGLPYWRELLSAFFFVIAIAAAVVIFVHDLQEMMVPESVSYVLLVASAGFGFSYLLNPLDVVYGGLIGLLPIAALVYPSKGKWMGEGDVKIAASLGLLTGYPAAIVFMVLSFMLGGAYGVLAIAAKRAKLRTAVPFAPFLIIGGLLALFYGMVIIYWYMGEIIVTRL